MPPLCGRLSDQSVDSPTKRKWGPWPWMDSEHNTSLEAIYAWHQAVITFWSFTRWPKGTWFYIYSDSLCTDWCCDTWFSCRCIISCDFLDPFVVIRQDCFISSMALSDINCSCGQFLGNNIHNIVNIIHVYILEVCLVPQTLGFVKMALQQMT